MAAAPAPPAPGKAAAPRASRPPSAGKARKAAAQAAPADPDGEIPAYARPPAKTGNLGEIILRNSIEAALSLDKDNLRELYNRYALGFPGLSGEVVIGLTVDPGGRILEGSVVSSTTGVEAFDQELLRKVLDWRLRSFPESRPKFISVPFLFPMQGH
jgi:TonB family protein